jgi:hypothetical protein
MNGKRDKTRSHKKVRTTVGRKLKKKKISSSADILSGGGGSLHALVGKRPDPAFFYQMKFPLLCCFHVTMQQAIFYSGSPAV